MPNGGPAPEAVTEAMFARTQAITEYRILEAQDVDLSVIGTQHAGRHGGGGGGPGGRLCRADGDAVRLPRHPRDVRARLPHADGRMCAVTGPYAVEILENRLGAPAGTVVNATPLPDFGGMHPDPNPTWAKALMDEMMGRTRPISARPRRRRRPQHGPGAGDLCLALRQSGGAGGQRASGARLCGGLKGMARSMPTSAAVDRVAAALGIAAYETPTGWKFFGNLLDAGRATMCGEESFGTGSDHVREKDGLWAVLLWLNILAVRGGSVADILQDHWARHGRNYYSRHDFEAIETARPRR
jgi:phosphoglucomutase